MRNSILIFILIVNFKQFSLDKIKNNEKLVENVGKTDFQSEIYKQIDFVKLKGLDQKLNKIANKIEILDEEGTNGLTNGLKKNLKVLIEQAKTMFNQVENSAQNSSKFEGNLDPSIPQSAHKIALEIYNQIVNSVQQNEHISSLKNAKIFEFKELIKEGPNKLLNELVDMINEILEGKEMDNIKNINMGFSMWKTLAFGFDWNKIVGNLNCPFNKKKAFVRPKHAINSIGRRYKRALGWNRPNMLCTADTDGIWCSGRIICFLILLLLILHGIAAVVIYLVWPKHCIHY